MLKNQKVIWTHAGQQNRLLEKLERPAQETPKAQMYRKNQMKLEIALLESFYVILKDMKKQLKNVFEKCA